MTETKTALRQQLSSLFPDHDLQQWFDPLGVEFEHDKKTVTITFPHIFFESWFTASKKSAFENLALPYFDNAILSYKVMAPFSSPHNALHTVTALHHISADSPLPYPKMIQKSNKSASNTSERPFHGYSFETFLTNKKNDFPLAAAKEMAHNPFLSPYQPFIIFGKSGCGKTHLLGAIAHSFTYHFPDTPFFYGTASEFFHPESTHTDAAVFFLDDIQRTSSDSSKQNQLLAFFDQAKTTGCPIVAALDVHPAQYSGFQQKLRMRLNAGLVIELKKPDLDVRHRYIQKKNTSLAIGLQKELMLTIAQRYPDFRLIDGIINKIQLYKHLINDSNKDTLALLDSLAGEEILTAPRIISIVSEFYSISAEEITGKNRNRKISAARQMALYLCRDLLGLPLIQIGEFFGGLDHSSVLYAVNKIKKIKDTNKDMNNTLSQLKNMCLFHVS